MGKKFDHVVSEMNAYINAMKVPPTKIVVRHKDFEIMEKAAKKGIGGGVIWWNGTLEYKGIPIEPLGEE